MLILLCFLKGNITAGKYDLSTAKSLTVNVHLSHSDGVFFAPVSRQWNRIDKITFAATRRLSFGHVRTSTREASSKSGAKWRGDRVTSTPSPSTQLNEEARAFPLQMSSVANDAIVNITQSDMALIIIPFYPRENDIQSGSSSWTGKISALSHLFKKFNINKLLA